ncbi:hypothetical protein [Pseudovibrio sp. Tun.PSC04-5.I4]|uniref:hypothetical protein n=1 Tax=Pseudovibrio sp. Tun.PSC04-5.I4 TaxID=1798213 RepID=UPI000884615C|nr:hypothetical protein [Pseudovibrio sp. Tun.PSC04-5.I4]SDR24203.1 hypothetical protein SAMN04515695_3706 [Pseudovibrio sp. Tun.PSC04-5.I4]
MFNPADILDPEKKRARLFPVLSENSKEGRALSILLSCLQNIPEFGHALLNDIGVRIGTRTKIETYTEVVFPTAKGESKLRPDGLIVVKSSAKVWTALVEAKIGNADLDVAQIESYMDIAKVNKIDAVITISNQFAPLPSHHPLTVSAATRKKADLYHWSWMYVLTEASLLLQGDLIDDLERRIIVNEFVRFLTHPSAGIKSFTQMPAAWTTVVSAVQAGGAISQNSGDAKEVIGAWHQEARDLSLILSRQLGRDVNIKTTRAHALDHQARVKSDLQTLSVETRLETTLSVPNAAGPVKICADLQTKSISVYMRLKAPEDRRSTKARTNWVLRQLQAAEPANIHVRHFWPGPGAFSQYSLADLRQDPNLAFEEKPNAIVSSFEVVMVCDLSNKFTQRKNFISELERIVPEFYEQVGQNLKAWQPPAPRLRENKTEADDVSPQALAEAADSAEFETTE